jgi:hypothetical protein
MEATCSSEASVDFQRATRRCIPGNRAHDHRCDNLKFYNITFALHLPACPVLEALTFLLYACVLAISFLLAVVRLVSAVGVPNRVARRRFSSGITVVLSYN